MSATEDGVRFLKDLVLTVVGMFIAMGGVALIVFQRQWLGVLPLVAGGSIVWRARPSIVKASASDPAQDPYTAAVPDRSPCKRCSAPTISRWQKHCLLCDWQSGDPVDVASVRADLKFTSHLEQDLRRRLLTLYASTEKQTDGDRTALWREIMEVEAELSAAYTKRLRARLE